MSGAFGSVRLQDDGVLARVVLSNPAKFNAMSRKMWWELRQIFVDLHGRGGLRCVVLVGAGGHFCSGGDIAEYPGFRFVESSLRDFHEEDVWGALQSVQDCPVPVIAEIQGNCMGAGVELACCCDIRVAGGGARFGAPIARLGFPMAPREAQLVSRELGLQMARSMLLEAAVFEADQMLMHGFLNSVVSESELAGHVLKRAADVCRLAPQAARLNKLTLRVLTGSGEKDALFKQAYAYANTAEHREGIAAFLAKRPPAF
ncbi:MAG TPA: enoyl-CoA hydratase/isomerase family protein [Hydrogenophaga sp.]